MHKFKVLLFLLYKSILFFKKTKTKKKVIKIEITFLIKKTIHGLSKQLSKEKSMQDHTHKVIPKPQ